jgi:membrane protein required for colicin V production
MENITYFDTMLGSAIVLLGLKGFINGFIKELFGLFGIIGGTYVGTNYSADIGALVNDEFFHLNNQSAIELTGFLITLVVFLTTLTILGTILTKLSSVSGLGIVNKLFGVLAGNIKFFFIFSILIYIAMNFKVTNDILENSTKDSVLFPILRDTGAYLVKIETFKIDEKIEQINTSGQNTLEVVEENLIKALENSNE